MLKIALLLYLSHGGRFCQWSVFVPQSLNGTAQPQSVHSITGRSRAEALQSRLMDVELFAGGRWIRTSGSGEREQGFEPRSVACEG